MLLLASTTVASTTLAANLDNLPRPAIKTTEFPSAEPNVEIKEPTIQQEFSVTDQDLKNDIELTETLLNQAILVHRWDLVERILVIYQDFDNKDMILIKFAEAGLAKNSNDIKKTISLYREIIAVRPDLTPVRLELAIALFEDRQDEAAHEQFNRVLSDTPPEDIKKYANLYINALNKRDSWSISLGLNYLDEDNIGNISNEREIENTGFIKGDSMMPTSGKGIGIYFGAQRDFNLKNNHYLRLENSLFSKSYWDNHDYDDLINRFSIGYVNKSNQQTIALLPFYEKRWYGGKQYKDDKGLRLEYDYWFNPNFRSVSALEYSKQSYKDYKQLDGHNKLFSTTLFWITKPEQFFFTGIDFFAVFKSKCSVRSTFFLVSSSI